MLQERPPAQRLAQGHEGHMRVSLDRAHSQAADPKRRENAARVTKWKKWKEPRIQAFAREQYDLRWTGWAGHSDDT
jgi:hypothetical protein